MGAPEGRVKIHLRCLTDGSVRQEWQYCIVAKKIEEEIGDGKGGRENRAEGRGDGGEGILRVMRIIPREVEHFD